MLSSGDVVTELKDKVCIVIGASKGLGRTFTLAMSEEGAKVAINGRNDQDLQNLFEGIHQKGHEVFIAKADVSQSEEVNREERRYMSCRSRFC